MQCISPVSSLDEKDPFRLFTGETCAFCGEPEYIELVEVWDDHSFMLGACCGDCQEEWQAMMGDDPEFAASVLRSLEVESATGHDLRRVAYTEEGYGPVLLDFQLAIRPVTQQRARTFIRQHHRHNPPPAGWKFGAGIFNGHTLLGVIWVGNPVNRVLQSRGWLEVNRLCLDHSLPKEITWKGCSLAYGWAKTEAKRRGAAQLCTYTLVSEEGMSLRYARWKPDALVKGRSWNCASRPRTDKGPIEDKMRWRAW